jgi:hypothetical protein
MLGFTGVLQILASSWRSKRQLSHFQWFFLLFFIYMPERFIKEKPREKKQVRKNQSEKQQLL